MTREEAIKELKKHKETLNLWDCIPLEDLQSFDIAIADMEKQIPKKPKEYEDKYYACECGNILLPKWKKYNTELMPKSEGLPHCMSCGQAIDWTEEGET